MRAAVSRKREGRAFDFGDPPLSDRGRTDHRQLQMNENPWERIRLFVPERRGQSTKVRSLSSFCSSFLRLTVYVKKDPAVSEGMVCGSFKYIYICTINSPFQQVNWFVVTIVCAVLVIGQSAQFII